ncbi:hypothetical protein V1514DRAFT_337909 [Lipomyces japonicus]|uniref:uncharacterized protein n=1 Tax=Lipomyces japonicus TaxID=56871 RepID=UPI0034CF68DF
MAEAVSVSVKTAPTAANGSDDSSIKQRIITHMNKDHQVSLRDYLVYYKNIVPTRNVELKDIQLDFITIGYEIIHNKGIDVLEAKIELQPPMKSLGQARDLLVGMALQASEGLGYATTSPVTKYIPPRPISYPIVVAMLAGIYYVFLDSSVINDPASSLRQYKVQNIEFIPLVIKILVWLATIYHLVEAFIIYIWTGMYRVPALTRLAWFISAFLEGFPAMIRFKSLMEEKDKTSEETKKSVGKKN